VYLTNTVATHYNTLQHAAKTLPNTAAHCNILQHTATHGRTLQHTTTRSNLQNTESETLTQKDRCESEMFVIDCNTVQHAATRCNTLQHTATYDVRRATLSHAKTNVNSRFSSCTVNRTMPVGRDCAVFICTKKKERSKPREYNSNKGNVSSCIQICIVRRIHQLLVLKAWSETTLQNTAKHCNILQHTATQCNTLHHTALHTQQPTATHCNTPAPTARSQGM